jgi:hypothetical protein
MTLLMNVSISLASTSRNKRSFDSSETLSCCSPASGPNPNSASGTCECDALCCCSMTDPGSEPLVDTDVLGDVLPVEDGILEEERERLPASDSGVGVVRLMSVIDGTNDLERIRPRWALTRLILHFRRSLPLQHCCLAAVAYAPATFSLRHRCSLHGPAGLIYWARCRCQSDEGIQHRLEDRYCRLGRRQGRRSQGGGGHDGGGHWNQRCPVSELRLDMLQSYRGLTLSKESEARVKGRSMRVLKWSRLLTSSDRRCHDAV